MNCEEIKNLITINVFGKLTDSEKARLEDHLQKCPKCAGLHEKSAQFSLPSEDEEDIPLPDKEKSWQVIRAESFQKRKSWKGFFPYQKWAFAASALVVVFILGFLIGKRFLFPPQTARQPESLASQGYDLPIQSYAENLELLLISFMNRADTPKKEQMSDLEKKVIEDMLIQTKLLKHLVSQGDDPHLLPLIEDLEFILVSISNLRPQDQDSAAQLARMIRENDLKFRVKTLLTSKTTI